MASTKFESNPELVQLETAIKSKLRTQKNYEQYFQSRVRFLARLVDTSRTTANICIGIAETKFMRVDEKKTERERLVNHFLGMIHQLLNNPWIFTLSKHGRSAVRGTIARVENSFDRVRADAMLFMIKKTLYDILAAAKHDFFSGVGVPDKVYSFVYSQFQEAFGRFGAFGSLRTKNTTVKIFQLINANSDEKTDLYYDFVFALDESTLSNKIREPFTSLLKKVQSYQNNYNKNNNNKNKNNKNIITNSFNKNNNKNAAKEKKLANLIKSYTNTFDKFPKGWKKEYGALQVLYANDPYSKLQKIVANLYNVTGNIGVDMNLSNLSNLSNRSKQQNFRNAILKSTKCVICSELLESGETVRTLSCNHVFHKECIEGWNKECPTCRSTRADSRNYTIRKANAK